ncbi:MAG: shikimate dehydrogenase [Hyphomicrobiales bacterium]
MKKYGLIGYPLTHSFSKRHFTAKFNMLRIEAEYNNYEIKNIESLHQIIENEPQLVGLNITIPYKQSVLPFLNHLNPIAEQAQAVNTIKIFRDKGRTELHGYNTDIPGFRDTLKDIKLPKRALILGTGGASRAIQIALEGLGIETIYASRTNQSNRIISYNEIDKNVIQENLLIVNATPLGMYPNVDSLPQLPYHLLTEDHILYDLVYNPEVSGFLKQGIERNCKTINGYQMLINQAEYSWKIWNS